MREPLEEKSGPPHAHHWKVSQAKNKNKKLLTSYPWNPTARFRALTILNPAAKEQSVHGARRSGGLLKSLPTRFLDTKMRWLDAADTFCVIYFFFLDAEKATTKTKTNQKKNAGAQTESGTRSAPQCVTSKPHSAFFAPVRYPVIRR